MKMQLSTLLCCFLLVMVRPFKAEGGQLFDKYRLTSEEQEKVDALTQEQLDKELKDEKEFAKIDQAVSRDGSSVDQHRKFTFTSLKSVMKGRQHRVNVIAVKQSLNVKNVLRDDIKQLLAEGFGPEVFCGDNCTCDVQSPYRTADGSCNNLRKTSWGMASIPMRRWLDPVYDDGFSSPREVSVLGGPLPSARRVSYIVHIPSTSADQSYRFTHMLMQWGQFLDHDMTSTPTQQVPDATGTNSSAVACCEDLSGGVLTQAQLDARPQCFPIIIPQPDPYFPNKDCMNFIRSVQVVNADCQPAPVEQMNQNTGYIDASTVYGSSQEDSNKLRLFRNGLLKKKDVNHLPEDPSTPPSCNTPATEEFPKDYCFKQITFNEYLPIILGHEKMDDYGLTLKRSGYANVYDDETDASIRNSFATAAFRMGHSMIKDYLSSYDVGYDSLGNDQLKDVFGNTNKILSEVNREIGPYMRGLVTDRAQKVDYKLTKMVTAFLFQDDKGNSFDLAALNIQRGRDHGIPPYLTWREFCGNTNPVHTFSDLSDTHDASAWRKLQTAYTPGSVHDIDLFPGALSERPVDGDLVGPTFACLIAKQFQLQKRGDRFWFEEDNPNVSFSPEQLEALRQATLSRVVCDNTDTSAIQANAFLIKDDLVSCSTLPVDDLSPWADRGESP